MIKLNSYGVETKRLKEQVRRNLERFPDDFMFELTKNEFEILRSQFASSSWGGLRYLEEYPDYMTQGETFEELQENLRDIYSELTSGSIPCVRRADELEVA